MTLHNLIRLAHQRRCQATRASRHQQAGEALRAYVVALEGYRSELAEALELLAQEPYRAASLLEVQDLLAKGRKGQL